MKKALMLATVLLAMPLQALATSPPPTNYEVSIYITLESGKVIEVPKGGSPCEYHKLYCAKGWKKDGTFPFLGGAKFFEAVLIKMKKNAYAAGYEAGQKTCDMPPTEIDKIPPCTGELVVSPHICKPTEPVEVEQCEGKLVVSPSIGGSCDD